jgi:DNA-binding transcriptional LysR family regulator
MNEINISKVDLNLLKSLKVLLAEKHVGKAANKMSVSQSAMSHTLSRLRETFDDPLFTRTSKGLEPTARAIELSRPLALILNNINTLLAPSIFSPTTLNAVFKIHTHDFILSNYLINAISDVKSQAPGIKFAIHSFNKMSYELLEKGECDLIIGAGHSTKSNFIQKRFVDENLVCLLDKNHQALSNWTDKEIFNYPHIKLSLLDDKIDPVTVYCKEKAYGERQIGIYTESLHTQPVLLKNTNLIAFLPETLSNSSAKQLDLVVKDCPFELPKLTIKGTWHERSKNEPAHQWIRNMLIDSITQP